MKKLLFLGTGTSNGVPVIGCSCRVCTSSDVRNKRLRSSVLYIQDGVYIQIDVGPDFREQALHHRIHYLDAVLITHSHQDHIGGLDDLRALNFIMKRRIPVFGNQSTLDEIKEHYSYLFRETQKGGGKAQVDLHSLVAQEKFDISGVEIQPLEVIHGRLSILGYRIGDFVYITDASRLPETTLQNLCTNPPKIMVLNALRYRPHPTHFNLVQSLEVIDKVQPKQAFLTHLTHRFEHSELSKELPKGVFVAYDGLEIEW